jgi:histidyl-tRNA synthetase
MSSPHLYCACACVWQFTQFGVELIGTREVETGCAQADLDVILLGTHVLRALQVFPAHTLVRLAVGMVE